MVQAALLRNARVEMLGRDLPHLVHPMAKDPVVPTARPQAEHAQRLGVRTRNRNRLTGPRSRCTPARTYVRLGSDGMPRSDRSALVDSGELSGGSSNGRTPGFGPGNRGPSPRPPVDEDARLSRPTASRSSGSSSGSASAAAMSAGLRRPRSAWSRPVSIPARAAAVNAVDRASGLSQASSGSSNSPGTGGPRRAGRGRCRTPDRWPDRSHRPGRRGPRPGARNASGAARARASAAGWRRPTAGQYPRRPPRRSSRALRAGRARALNWIAPGATASAAASARSWSSADQSRPAPRPARSAMASVPGQGAMTRTVGEPAKPASALLEAVHRARRPCRLARQPRDAPVKTSANTAGLAPISSISSATGVGCAGDAPRWRSR